MHQENDPTMQLSQSITLEFKVDKVYGFYRKFWDFYAVVLYLIAFFPIS